MYHGKFKPSIEEYLAQKDPYFEAKYKEKLLAEARTAIAWGVPDRESTGYSSTEFIKLIAKLAKYIERN